MANPQENGQAKIEEASTKAENALLAAQVQQLQSECDQLRRALAKCEEERNLYLKAVYEHHRANREFEDVDIPSLEAISAGPVELID
ncbi:MAG: hypothetical protein L0Y72_08475 [Gemmataceae bacterium]|nr:hypothetical protein [Gemmataceae bacterium]